MRVWNHRSRWVLHLQAPQVHYVPRDTDSGARFLLLILFLARKKIGQGPGSALAHPWRIAIAEELGGILIVPSAGVPLPQVSTWLTASLHFLLKCHVTREAFPSLKRLFCLHLFFYCLIFLNCTLLPLDVFIMDFSFLYIYYIIYLFLRHGITM